MREDREKDIGRVDLDSAGWRGTKSCDSMTGTNRRREKVSQSFTLRQPHRLCQQRFGAKSEGRPRERPSGAGR